MRINKCVVFLLCGSLFFTCYLFFNISTFGNTPHNSLHTQCFQFCEEQYREKQAEQGEYMEPVVCLEQKPLNNDSKSDAAVIQRLSSTFRKVRM